MMNVCRVLSKTLKITFILVWLNMNIGMGTKVSLLLYSTILDRSRKISKDWIMNT